MKDYTDLLTLVSARNVLLKIEARTPAQESEIDSMTEEVMSYVKQYQEELPIEVVIESLTHLGDAPSILYDDNGHFAIAMEGSQNLIFDEQRGEETIFSATWFIPPNGWKRTIREALAFYLDWKTRED